MQEGAPSVNATGRAGVAATVHAAVTAALEGAVKHTLRAAPGSDGVIAYGGYLVEGEKNPKLRGSTKWVEQDNLIANMATVAASTRLWLDLAGSVKWSAKENPRGGTDAKRCVQLVEEGLLRARMTKPWRRCVRKQVMAELRGFALHSKGTKRDSQGRIVFSELRPLPQHTIEQWLKPTETEPWKAVVQRTATKPYQVERGDLWYSVDDALGESPAGTGIFRHLQRIGEIFERYRQLHGIAADTDVNGIPVGRAPIGKLWQQACRPVSEGGGGLSGNDTAAISTWVQRRTSQLTDLLENRVVTPNRSLLLDSLPYFSIETDTSAKPSSIFEWSIDTVRAAISSMPELREVLDDMNFDVARIMCTEFLLMGEGEGSRAQHTDKTRNLTRRLNGVLDNTADDGDRDLVWWIVAKNGYDPERCAPSLEHEPIDEKDIIGFAEMLAALAKAKYRPDDPIHNWFRDHIDAPHMPEGDNTETGDKPSPAKKPKKKEGDDVPDPGEGDDK